MPAYLIADMDASDPARYEEYKRLAPPAIEKYGGRYLARGGRTEVLEGEWSPKRFVIVEFESMEKVKAFFDSPEYRAARKAREGAGVFRMLAVEGL
ncbi:MAG: DUF1330 domain-containing protein [Burkholderiales bacterium]|nr:DUF1330 domain-containing protein [Burkholderiales bacterium]